MAEQFVASARELAGARSRRFRLRTALRRAALTGLAALPRRRREGVRIVHYHYVFDDEREQFARQLAWLAREFEPVSLTEAVQRLRDNRESGRELVITFDDGFRNQLANAAPRLASRGFSACFFLMTGLVSASADKAAQICRERLHLPRPVEPMSWDDVGDLLELGHEVGSHSRTHPDLLELEEVELLEELGESKRELEARLGRPVRHFSAPYGDRERFDAVISAAAEKAGYESCSSALRGVNGPSSDPFALRRDHLVAGWPLRDLRYFLA